VVEVGEAVGPRGWALCANVKQGPPHSLPTSHSRMCTE